MQTRYTHSVELFVDDFHFMVSLHISWAIIPEMRISIEVQKCAQWVHIVIVAVREGVTCKLYVRTRSSCLLTISISWSHCTYHGLSFLKCASRSRSNSLLGLFKGFRL